MPEQSSFLGFHYIDTEGLQAKGTPSNFIEVAGGDPYLPIERADPSRRLININVVGENIDENQRWNGERQVWLVSHGWNGRYETFVHGEQADYAPGYYVPSLAQQIKLAHPDDIVLALDWQEASSTSFPFAGEFSDANDVAGVATSLNYFAATWIGSVGEKVAQQLAAWGVNGDHVNLIGHSLGTQLNTEIAYQLKERGLGKVASLTALDPASDYNRPSLAVLGRILDQISPVLAPILFNRYSGGYTYKRKGADGQLVDVHPPAYQDVSNFSRAFLGRTSIAGSVEYSSQANEAILMDFGSLSAAEHINVATAFGQLINPFAPSLVRNLLELDDYQTHSTFQQNAFIANDIFIRRNFEGVLLTDPYIIRGFYAKKATGEGFIIFGTDVQDKVTLTPYRSGTRFQTSQMNGKPLDPLIYYGSNTYYLGLGNDELTSSNGNDIIYGDFPKEWLQIDKWKPSAVLPETYDDTINAGAGNDTVYGGWGTDTIKGSDGTDRLYGEDDKDYLYGGADTDYIDGGQGNDYIQGNTGNDVLYGDSGDDILLGGADQDIIYGDASSSDNSPKTLDARDPSQTYDDTIDGGADRDALYGGWGNDILRGGTGNDILLGGDDTDRLFGEEDDDDIQGDGGDDRLFGGDGDDQISGGADHDHLDGGGGSDQLKGEDGNDFLTGSLGNDLLIGGAGIDRLYGGDGFDTLYGDDPAAAVLPGIFYNDTIDGGTGIDQIQGGWGNDTIWGGTNNDIINGDWDDSSVAQSATTTSNDTIYGNNGRDTIRGSWGDDVIWGGDDTDILYGNDGNDIIHGGENTPVPLAPPVIIIGTGYGIGLADEFELLDGGKGDDTLYGDSGNDQLYGKEDNDQLYGGEGNDQLWGGSGDDQLNGGEGNDQLYGGHNQDILSGDSGDDQLNGGEGNDKLYGRLNNDNLYGGLGDDELEGGSGDDWLSGVDSQNPSGAGEIDQLSGGSGKDTFVLGDATTAFYFQTASNALYAGNLDYALITDFNTQKDKIQLKGKASDYALGQAPAGLPTGTGIYSKGSGVDLVFLSDRSGSFKSYSAVERRFAHNLMTGLQQRQIDAQYGVSSFVDIPEYPLGQNKETIYTLVPEERVPDRIVGSESIPTENGGFAYLPVWEPGYVIPEHYETDIINVGDAYVYGLSLNLTNSAAQVESTLDDLPFQVQADAPEDQLMALSYLAQDTGISFRNGSTRIAIIMTDSSFHRQGDVLTAGLDLGYDYPAIAQVRTNLEQAHILPIFVVTSNVVAEYRSLAAQLGFDDRIVFDLGAVANNPSQLTAQIAATSRDLIGIVQGGGLNLNASYFSYIS